MGFSQGDFIQSEKLELQKLYKVKLIFLLKRSFVQTSYS